MLFLQAPHETEAKKCPALTRSRTGRWRSSQGSISAPRGLGIKVDTPLRRLTRSGRGATGKSFVDFKQNVARGLKVRYDYGSAFLSDDHPDGLPFLGIKPASAFARAFEYKGCAELFVRTLRSSCCGCELPNRLVAPGTTRGVRTFQQAVANRSPRPSCDVSGLR